MRKPIWNIEHITSDEAAEIIETQQREGLFWLKEDDVYIGIDNTTKDAWVEEFHTLKHCKKWLMNRELTKDDLQ